METKNKQTKYKCIACSTQNEQVLVKGYQHSESGMLACERCGSNELEEVEETTETKEDDLILLKWDAVRGEHHQVILTKSLQQPKKGTVYLHEGMRMQKTYEEK